MCPDCRECRANFDADGVEYEFIDINESLRSLKDFLALRDSLPVFDRAKQVGDIGLPAAVREDGSVFLDWEAYLTELGLPIVFRESGRACGPDRKGC